MTIFERKSLANSKHGGTEPTAVQTPKALNPAFHLKDILSSLGIIIANPLLRATKSDLNGKPAASPAEAAAATSKTAFLWKSVNSLTLICLRSDSQGTIYPGLWAIIAQFVLIMSLVPKDVFHCKLSNSCWLKDAKLKALSSRGELYLHVFNF